MTDMPEEIELLVLAELKSRVLSRIEQVKAVVGQRYPEGHRDTFRSPIDDHRLGSVYRTDPDPVWEVTDREALDAELRTYPGALETVYEITDEAAAVEVLREHAPHLLAEITRVNPDVITAALEQSRTTGKAAAPGISKVKPAGVLTVTTDKKTAGLAIEAMHEQGVITWDGRPAIEQRKAAS